VFTLVHKTILYDDLAAFLKNIADKSDQFWEILVVEFVANEQLTRQVFKRVAFIDFEVLLLSFAHLNLNSS
jgi:hypothetical protein